MTPAALRLALGLELLEVGTVHTPRPRAPHPPKSNSNFQFKDSNSNFEVLTADVTAIWCLARPGNVSLTLT